MAAKWALGVLMWFTPVAVWLGIIVIAGSLLPEDMEVSTWASVGLAALALPLWVAAVGMVQESDGSWPLSFGPPFWRL